MSGADPRSFWDQRFDQEDYLFGKEPNAFLVSQAPLLRPGQRALSVADGEGRNSVWLALEGLDVTAVELSAPAIAKARRLADERGVNVGFHQADLLDWDFGQGRYDVIAAIFIQFLAPVEREVVFQRMAAALRPGGWLILQGYTPKQLEYRTGGPPCAENLYTSDLLMGAFAGLEIMHLWEHEAHVVEGTGHVGWSALIDLVARRPAEG
ncbi:MAG: class I SAM-dependent methyltransferase [Rhodocyclaceae bacterium]